MIKDLIQTLFYTNNRIIVPNFGAFLPNGFDELGNCKFIFSSNLKFNDGFLIRQLIEGENLSYAEAQAKIESFVRSIQDELQSKRVALLSGFGGFFYDNKNTLHFLLEKDVVTANEKIRQIVEKENRGELMDIRLDEFVLSYSKTKNESSLTEENIVKTIEETVVDTLPEIKSPESNKIETENIITEHNIEKSHAKQDDFFDLNISTPQVDESFEVEKQLRKAQEVELLQKKLEELEKAKNEYLEKIKKEEKRKLEGLEKIKQEEEKKKEVSKEPTVEKSVSEHNVSKVWNTQEKRAATPVEESKPIEIQRKENEDNKTSQEGNRSWQKSKSPTNSIEQMFAYRGQANQKRRDILPVILITVLLLVIFSTAGFLYFKEEITNIFFSKNQESTSEVTTNKVIDLSSSSLQTYHVVVKNFSKKGDAQRYLQALKSKNPNIDAQILPQPGNIYYISINRYKNEKDADAAVAKLKPTIPSVKKITVK